MARLLQELQRHEDKILRLELICDTQATDVREKLKASTDLVQAQGAEPSTTTGKAAEILSRAPSIGAAAEAGSSSFSSSLGSSSGSSGDSIAEPPPGLGPLADLGFGETVTALLRVPQVAVGENSEVSSLEGERESSGVTTVAG
eukprot:RCo040174